MTDSPPPTDQTAMHQRPAVLFVCVAQTLAEVGVDITGETPKPIEPQLLRGVDVVVTLGREAYVDPTPGTRFERWDTDEPSERAIDGIERTHLVPDDIGERVADLYTQLQARSV